MSTTVRVRPLDGLRGFALIGMLAWHAQLSWIKGGFARMTVFFVLSGYLTARSLMRLSEDGAGRGFGRFWSRRARRLLPMTLIGVVVAIAVTAQWGSSTARADGFGDTLSVLTSWANWRFLLGDRPYGALFEAPSAFQHYWSLSVEEQCILLLPLIVGFVTWFLGRFRRVDPSGRGRVVAIVALGSASCLLPLFVPMATDTVYYGTHVRLGEFLMGVALALAWPRGGEAMSAAAVRAWSWGGAVGLVTLATIMLTIDRTAAWVYRGGMGLVSVPVVAVIGATLVGGRFVGVVLSFPPFVAFGRAALSIYVLHWPIYQAVEAEMPGSTRSVVVAVEIAVSLVVGFAAYRFIERPLLPGSTGAFGRAWARPRVAFPIAATTAVLCLLAATVIPASEPEIDFARLAREQAAAIAAQPEGAASGESSGAAPTQEGFAAFRDGSLVGVALFGGSTALTLGMGYDGWVQPAPWTQGVPGYSPLGCGLLDEGERAGGNDPGNRLPEGAVPEECSQRSRRWSETAKAHGVQAPVVIASTADLTTWRFRPGDPWRAVGDTEVDRRLTEALLETVDTFTAAGAQRVVFTTPMSPRRDEAREVANVRRRRNERYRQLLTGVADQRSNVVVVDFGTWSSELSDAEFRRLIPDGIHFGREGAQRAWAEVLGPALDHLHQLGDLVPPAG